LQVWLSGSQIVSPQQSSLLEHGHVEPAGMQHHDWSSPPTAAQSRSGAQQSEGLLQGNCKSTQLSGAVHVPFVHTYSPQQSSSDAQPALFALQQALSLSAPIVVQMASKSQQSSAVSQIDWVSEQVAPASFVPDASPALASLGRDASGTAASFVETTLPASVRRPASTRGGGLESATGMGCASMSSPLLPCAVSSPPLSFAVKPGESLPSDPHAATDPPTMAIAPTTPASRVRTKPRAESADRAVAGLDISLNPRGGWKAELRR
jgi:hypothetical protein